MTDRTDLLILLDRSGSMQAGRADHEGGLRSFVRDAARLAGDVRLTFVRFDSRDPCEVVFEARPVAEVKDDELTLVPVGIEIGRAATDLRDYKHPAPAVYILGAEDHGLTNAAAALCRDLVVIPAAYCLNVAVAGSLVMYDRAAKKTSPNPLMRRRRDDGIE